MLKEFLTVNKKAFTAVLVGSILAIMIGAIMLIVTYTILSAVITSMGTVTNAALNTSLQSNITVITQALNIVGIGLIISGVAGIIYILLGVAGAAGGRGA